MCCIVGSAVSIRTGRGFRNLSIDKEVEELHVTRFRDIVDVDTPFPEARLRHGRVMYRVLVVVKDALDARLAPLVNDSATSFSKKDRLLVGEGAT